MFGKKDALPDPEESVKVPDHLRMPFFKGKTAPPTTILSPEQRHIQMEPPRTGSFLKGLLAGPLLLIGLDLAGAFLVRYLPESIRLSPPIPLRVLLFVPLALAALLGILALSLGKQRRISAPALLGLALGALAGCAWFLIPRPPLQ